jgi:hypothetical protein
MTEFFILSQIDLTCCFSSIIDSLIKELSNDLMSRIFVNFLDDPDQIVGMNLEDMTKKLLKVIT